VLGFLVLRRWLGRAPLAAGALMSAGFTSSLLDLPRVPVVEIALSVVVTVLSIAALLEGLRMPSALRKIRRGPDD